MPTITTEQAIRIALDHHLAGSFSQAEELYKQVLSVNPTHAEALRLLGSLCGQTGRAQAAVEWLGKAVAANPTDAQAHFNLGVALKDHGRLAEAIGAYRQSVACRADNPDALNNLGVVLYEDGQVDEAITALRAALRLKPNAARTINSLCVALINRGDFDEAEEMARRDLQMRPDDPQALNILANALKGKGQFDQALQAIHQALHLKGDFADGYCTLGNILTKMRRFDEAIDAYRQAATHQPNHWDAHNNLAVSLSDCGRIDEAIIACNEALRVDPNWPGGHWNLAMALLLRGDFQRGWEEYEWRWRWKDFPSPRRDFVQPPWRGDELKGQTILLYAEQGYGDTIQFIRYAGLVAARGGRVVVQCPPELSRLIKGVTGVAQIVTRDPLPPVDLQCPMLSLPLAFATRVETIPANVPYLAADPLLAEQWRTRVGAPSGRLKVGLVWAGSSTHKKDERRSIPFSQMARLGDVPNVTFFSLQKGKAAAERATVPRGMELIDLTNDLRDFADTAALISHLDLVIAVDTAVAHLAGAMGKPVWVLIPFVPDWRWMLDREDSPWYPTLRLFRQKKPGDWAEVIERVGKALAEFIPAPRINLEQTMRVALAHHLAGSFPEAENLYRQVLAANPAHARALRLLGTLLGQTNRPDAAIECLGRAISADPGDAEASFNLGVALMDKGRRSESIGAYRQAIACRAEYPDALHNLAVALLADGQIDEAIAAFTETLQLKPAQPSAHASLGAALLKRGDLDDAVAAARQALHLQPDNSQALNVLAGALKSKGRLEEAAEACRAAILARSDFSDAHCMLGNILTDMGRHDEALASYQQTLAHEPRHFSACLNIGHCLAKMGRHAEAYAAARQAIEIAPDLADPHYNLGNACKDLGDLEQAVLAYERAIELDPKCVDAHWNLAVVLLLQGNFDRGWLEHEWRWKVLDSDSHRRDFSQPLWDGAELNGQTILLHTEQGFGDAIQFIRYAPLVAGRGGRVIVRCSPAVARLFATIPGIEQLVTAEPLPPFDVHCPLMSLPLAFSTRLETIPAQVPYLKVDPALAERWAKKLNPDTNGLKVGLAWAGRATKKNDAARSLSLSQLAPLREAPGVTFYSLAKERISVGDGHGPQIIDFSDDLRDFAETAALISQLDLVISVDTAVAHLAGALGKPVWTLIPFIPDWRWMMDRQDCPWYPTMRLFRQKRDGDWAEVIQRVKEALRSKGVVHQ